VNESFDYELLEGQFWYEASILFAEGGMANPYFKNLPLDGTKGELFIIMPELNLDVIVNKVFYITIGWRLVQRGYLQLER
jgi:hypothetical protein